MQVTALADVYPYAGTMYLLVLAIASVLRGTRAVQTDLNPLVTTLRKPLYVDHVEHTISAYRLSRDIMQARWSDAWHEDLPCSEPKNKGAVHKVGLGTQSPTLRLKINEADAFVSEQMPIYVGCQVCTGSGDFEPLFCFCLEHTARKGKVVPPKMALNTLKVDTAQVLLPMVLVTSVVRIHITLSL